MEIGSATDGKEPLNGLTEARLAELRRGSKNGDAGREIEQLFATMLVKELRRGLKTGFFQGPGADVYTAWFDEHLGRTLAEGDALGLARLVDSYVEREDGAGEPTDGGPR